MNTKRLIQIGGVINLLFVVFHLSFWKLFSWGQSLICLSAEDRAVMQVLNIHTAYALAIFVLVSLAFPNELGTTKLGRTISLSIACFWILRGVNQLVFWDVSLAAWIILLICVGIGMLYILPVTRRVAQS